MDRTTTQLIGAVLICIVGVAALCGAGFFAMRTIVLRDAAAESRAAYREETERDQYANAVRALLRDTVEARAAVLGVVRGVDPVEAIQVVESVGTKVGAKVSIESVGQPTAVAEDAGLESLSIALRSTGSFTQLTALLQTLHALPLPSTIDSAALSTAEEGGWALSARVRIFLESQKKATSSPSRTL